MKRNANNALNCPHSKRSGASANSRTFIMATMVICKIAFNFGFHRDKIHIAMTTSERPMNRVNDFEYSSPRMRATMCSCLGTRWRILHSKPFTNQTNAISVLKRRYVKARGKVQSSGFGVQSSVFRVRCLTMPKKR